MPLDFFSCNDPKNINEGTPHFAMDERIHNYIFSGRDFRKYKVLPKFKDYYSDSVISLSETSALIDEICDMEDYDGVNKEAIDEFIRFVVNSIQYRHSIYIYSDRGKFNIQLYLV
ncbi:hypothetical protein QL189_19725 [Cronobacter turicensis]|uniref:hypothetical protein n=1 Tax=Cronobacter turicensis TaxID=413502 RepID=UPI0024A8E38C|nr:hypothetical protein [Cronobacter turicensis]EKM0440006.1 hypothetical protein [Cronobacter turicensis]ELY4324004.1 hypothetical protein [Cronobacter turicensis]ELY5944008.1 hypothetical protein [Cronobacter turicensis]ELY5965373.1 hypothetical protein [Cronobacter turicensis]MDI6419614.1 hypothetical protein [Cronobacter turicensis]